MWTLIYAVWLSSRAEEAASKMCRFCFVKDFIVFFFSRVKANWICRAVKKQRGQEDLPLCDVLNCYSSC